MSKEIIVVCKIDKNQKSWITLIVIVIRFSFFVRLHPSADNHFPRGEWLLSCIPCYTRSHENHFYSAHRSNVIFVNARELWWSISLCSNLWEKWWEKKRQRKRETNNRWETRWKVKRLRLLKRRSFIFI